MRYEVVGCRFDFDLLLGFAVVAIDYVDIVWFAGKAVATDYAVTFDYEVSHLTKYR